MSYIRSYFEKNNTILKNSQVNTAKNPTTEIFYGSGFSKFIFKVDFSELKNKVDSGEYVINDDTTHTLHLTNTIFGDETFLGAKRGTGRQRTNSFDIIVFKVSEFWDEGLGFDYEDGGYDFTTGNETFDERPSNWFNRTTLDSWGYEGIYANDPTIISTIHFDNGNEDINVDITDYVNGIIVSGNTNHGLGLAFAVLYQDINAEVDQSVAFFTKYTQTFFEPYVETYFNDRIDDDRHNFIERATQNLYLYVTKGTNFYDLDNVPTVDILDSNNNQIIGLSNLTTTKIKKGVYKVTFGLDGVLCDGKRFFFDKWKGLVLDGISISDVKQKFIPKPYTSLYTVGENQTELERYSIQFSGVKLNEKIIKGEKRKIVVKFRSINQPKTELFDEVYFRMFIKEGRTNVIVHDWTQLDVTNENSFTLNTENYVPREYWVELKGKTHTEEIFYGDYIKFEIVSEK
jgi:hypothetical protein